MSAGRSYLLVPAGGRGEGLGHLNRCRRLAEELARLKGEQRPRVTFLASDMDEASRAFLRRSLNGKGRGSNVVLALKPGIRWDLIVLDRRATSKEELRRFQESGPVVCLDEGGEARRTASFLIDAIPRLPEKSPSRGPLGGGSAPNLSSLSLLELPRRSRAKMKWPPRRVLISFGGEDKENLSSGLLDALLGNDIFNQSQITLVEGPLFAFHDWPAGITVVRNASGLEDRLRSCDVLFTHFGITALEAFASGTPAILLNPGQYHARLGRTVGFPDIGIRVPDVRLLKTLLADGATVRARLDAFNARTDRRRAWSLPTLLASLRPQGKPRCPVCARDGNSVLARFPERTYRLCRECGVTYLESFASAPTKYGARYFGQEYKAHYGRTYLEDFQAIKNASRDRLRIIRAMAGESLRGDIVDVGCAYGPFLSAVKDEALPCFGLDVSDEAVRYVRKSLGIPAVCSSFEAVKRRQLPGLISALTLWYVIEHFTDVGLVLRKAAALLSSGGILAFSTPNGQGISARKDLRAFLDNSPPDHFTIFRPAGLGRILASYGFELRRVRITGHHPERFPGLLGRLGTGDASGSRDAYGSRAASGAVAAASRLLRMGDTFEAYAVKVEEV